MIFGKDSSLKIYDKSHFEVALFLLLTNATHEYWGFASDFVHNFVLYSAIGSRQYLAIVFCSKISLIYKLRTTQFLHRASLTQ